MQSTCLAKGGRTLNGPGTDPGLCPIAPLHIELDPTQVSSTTINLSWPAASKVSGANAHIADEWTSCAKQHSSPAKGWPGAWTAAGGDR